MLRPKLLHTATALLALLFASTAAVAQYDDMYFDPDEFVSTERAPNYYRDNDRRDYADNDRSFRRSDAYADDYYDYYYSSRIRRFNRPYAGFGYFDPVYVDMAYYDPRFRPAGSTVLIYNDFNRFNRFNRFNSWNGGFVQPVITPFGVRYVNTGFNRWNRGFNNWGAWNDPFFAGGFNRGFYGGGFNAFGAPVGAFGGGGYFCPPAWGGGNVYTVPNSVTSNVINRPTSRVPRAATTSIADRVRAQRQRNDYSTPIQTRSATRSSATRGSRAVRSTGRSTRPSSSATRSSSRTRSNATRSRTYTPSRSASPSRTRSATPSRSRSGSGYTPSRSATPSRSTRSYTPSRSASPSRSTRSYTPSRSASPSRSRSATPSRSTSSRRGGGTR